MIYFLIIFLTYVILDLLNIFPYGIGRIPIEPESSIPGIKYLYAIGFSYIFAIVMSIFTPKRTILWILAFPPIALIYKIIGSPKTEVYIGDWTLLSLDKASERYKAFFLFSNL